MDGERAGDVVRRSGVRAFGIIGTCASIDTKGFGADRYLGETVGTVFGEVVTAAGDVA